MTTPDDPDDLAATASNIAARKAIAELLSVKAEAGFGGRSRAQFEAAEILVTFLNAHSDPMCKRVAAAWRRSAERCGFNNG